jgi:hypothetical protein
MTRRFLLTAVLLGGLAGSVFAQTTTAIHGAWTASVDLTKNDRIYLNIVRGGWQHNGNTMKLADFTSLTPAAVTSDTQTPVQFQLARDAGTISFEGTFKNGDGAGQFTFAPNRGYADSIRALGVAFELRHRENKSDEDNLFTLALLNVSTAYIKSLQAEGYRESLDQYMRMRIFNVTPQFIHELRDAGYTNVPAEKLVALRVHGVDIDYIRKMNTIE